MQIGPRIKEIRKEKKISQIDVSQSCGFTQSYLSAIENGLNNPSHDTLEQIVTKGLNVTMSYFYSLDDPDYIINSGENKLAGIIKEIGMDYLILTKELKDQGLSPDDVREMIKSFRSLGLIDK